MREIAAVINTALERRACGAQAGPNRWKLAITNGRSLPASLRLEDAFLQLAVPLEDLPLPIAAELLLNRQRRVNGLAKYALIANPWRAALRAEIPAEDSAGLEQRLHLLVDSITSAAALAHCKSSCETAGEPPAALHPDDESAASGGIEGLLRESGWSFEKRSAGEFVVPLETRSDYRQAAVRPDGSGLRLHSATVDGQPLSTESAMAIGSLLLESNSAMRMIRGYWERRDAEVEAGFEVRFPYFPTAAEADHALCALSVAERCCGRELRFLADEAAARCYLAVRKPPTINQ